MPNDLDEFEGVVIRCGCKNFARQTTDKKHTTFLYFCAETSTIRLKGYCDNCKKEVSCDIALADMIGRKVGEWGLKDDILQDMYITN